MFRKSVFAIVMTGCFLFTSVGVTQDVLFQEDFENVVLGESVEEAIFEDEVWAATYEGWTVVNMVPGQDEDEDFNGVTEWIGWTFADKDWWTATAGDQRRSEFTLGEGVVMVSDPDEWDDQPHPDSASEGWYNTFITSPSINVAGVSAGTIQVMFNSSWRDEFDDNWHQTANLTVTYDGGDPIEVLRWESDPDSDFFKDDLDPEESTDEEVILSLDNPAGVSSMALTFGLFDAGNDWWWAVDNVEVRGTKGGANGDYNGNGTLDAEDIDALSAAIRNGETGAEFDLDGNGVVEASDRSFWVDVLRGTWFGDSNLDGEFSSSDFVTVFIPAKYETGQPAGWAEGDWNGDGKFDSSDFVAAFIPGGYEQGPRPVANAVPEPSCIVLLAFGVLGLFRLRSHR